MGYRYIVKAFNYDSELDVKYDYLYDAFKKTNWLIVAIFWFIVWSVEYDGCDIEKRS